jgi:hypothetical protein
MNIKRIIREEMDDMDWIRDTQPPSYDSLVGKALEFEPYIDNMVDFKKIIELLSFMGFTCGPWVVNDFLFEDEEEEIVGLYLNDRGRVMYTSQTSEDYEYHISDYAGKPVEVLDGWVTLGNFLYRK